MLLTALPTGSVARVRAVSTESGAVLRLREMGVRPGALIRLTGRGASGAHILMIGASRIAVDKSTSALIDLDCS
jgi:ferrous iron transport protein A